MGLRRFYKYNGLLMTIHYVVVRRLKKISNWFIARKIKGCKKLNIALFPYLRGLSYVKIGKNFTAGRGLRLEVTEDYKGKSFKVEIGENVVLNDYVHIGCANRVTIGNNVLIASKVYITDHNHGYYDADHRDKHESPDVPPLKRLLTEDGYVEIADNVWIGEFVSILPYSRIGRCSIIGANSVVKGEIPPYSIAVGAPAKVIKQYDLGKKEWVPINKS